MGCFGISLAGCRLGIFGQGQEGSFWVFFLGFGVGFGLGWSNTIKGIKALYWCLCLLFGLLFWDRVINQAGVQDCLTFLSEGYPSICYFFFFGFWVFRFGERGSFPFVGFSGFVFYHCY